MQDVQRRGSAAHPAHVMKLSGLERSRLLLKLATGRSSLMSEAIDPVAQPLPFCNVSCQQPAMI